MARSTSASPASSERPSGGVGVGVAIALALVWSAAQAKEPPRQGLADMLLEYLGVRYPGTPLGGHILYVSVQRQQLFHVVDGRVRDSYPIATARAGLGNTADSFRTPPGLHRVVEKIGGGLPPGAVLKDRRPTGEVADLARADRSRDVITSRILRLEGLEDGVNRGGGVDSYARQIYVHGTGDEGSLNTPSSMGCVRMGNADIITLFDQVPVGTLVVILDN